MGPLPDVLRQARIPACPAVEDGTLGRVGQAWCAHPRGTHTQTFRPPGRGFRPQAPDGLIAGPRAKVAVLKRRIG
ncbi:hypothetical protein SCMC78_37730 [Streptomyces sp. CMC78]|uniref:Uncharacterized protein n=1 Tax=Streptomyces sp. CMC78 TaxID=3231512 RepID=A0AB33KIX9_9ACTN